MLLLAIVAITCLQQVVSECANACSGHGKCTAYDMCICHKNWQANDCSERICQFGKAHVDTPKGDLDLSGTITSTNRIVIENNFAYPYGTTEQFPTMEDTHHTATPNSAHYYMECSNKGVCDRTTGTCKCYDGYDGVACQRASCPGYPNSCSGHGVCKSIKQLAKEDNNNIYELWDKDSTMGCSCDAGYFGPDCSQRQCKSGVDPLYLDDVATVQFPQYDFAILTTKLTSPLFSDGRSEYNDGHFAIRFYDSTGEDWVTEPITAGASCGDVISALESLPNNVIPADSITCTRTAKVNGDYEAIGWSNLDSTHSQIAPHKYPIAYNMSIWEAQTNVLSGEISKYNPTMNFYNSYDSDFNYQKLAGYIYRLKFVGNPGKLKQPEIELYLDGRRPSLISSGYKVITKVWSDGQQGENKDYIANHCDGVAVQIAKNVVSKKYYLNGFTYATRNLLKACLGSSDFNLDNNVDIYNWDHGNFYYPHLIKLVRSVSSYADGGYYAVVYYDTTVTIDNLNHEGTFLLVNPFYPPDNLATDYYEVYTTAGTLALTSNFSQAMFSFASKYIYTVNVTYDVSSVNVTRYDGDISCEVGDNNADKLPYIQHCLNKGDMFTLLNWDSMSNNPEHINLYTAEKLFQTDLQWSARYENFGVDTPQMSPMNPNRAGHFMTHMITADSSTNWGATLYTLGETARFHVYKFFPDTSSTYEYVAPCSNRGICDWSSATCSCFPGYTSDDCSQQSSLAI